MTVRPTFVPFNNEWIISSPDAENRAIRGAPDAKVLIEPLGLHAEARAFEGRFERHLRAGRFELQAQQLQRERALRH